MARSIQSFASHTVCIASGLLAAVMTMVLPAQAQSRMPPVPEIGDTCFARSYSAAHLRSHNRQTISRIVLTSVNRRGQQPKLAKGAFEMVIGVQRRGTAQWAYSFAECTFRANGYGCKVESDGGSFVVLDRSDGTVRLATSGSIRMETTRGHIEFGDDYSDDNIFVLSPAACRSR